MPYLFVFTRYKLFNSDTLQTYTFARGKQLNGIMGHWGTFVLQNLESAPSVSSRQPPLRTPQEAQSKALKSGAAP